MLSYWGGGGVCLAAVSGLGARTFQERALCPRAANRLAEGRA